MMKFSFNEGVIWEDNPFEIELDLEYSSLHKPCKHCYDIKEKKHEAFHGDYVKYDYKIPAVVIVSNEGGNNTTGLCIKCLLESIQTKVIQQRLSDIKTGKK